MGGPMKDKLFILGRIIGLLIFVLAFSLLGIASGRPIMILAYAGFFIFVMGIIFLFIRHNQRHYEVISEGSQTIRKIIGIVMILVALAIPAVAISTMQLFAMGSVITGFGLVALVLGITILMVAAGMLGVYLINRQGNGLVHKIIGYIIIIIISAIPALLVIPTDKTTTGIGSVYYLAVLVSILSWWGFNLFLNKE
jgi:hypothetical protein